MRAPGCGAPSGKSNNTLRSGPAPGNAAGESRKLDSTHREVILARFPRPLRQSICLRHIKFVEIHSGRCRPATRVADERQQHGLSFEFVGEDHQVARRYALAQDHDQPMSLARDGLYRGVVKQQLKEGPDMGRQSRFDSVKVLLVTL